MCDKIQSESVQIRVYVSLDTARLLDIARLVRCLRMLLLHDVAFDDFLGQLRHAIIWHTFVLSLNFA